MNRFIILFITTLLLLSACHAADIVNRPTSVPAQFPSVSSPVVNGDFIWWEAEQPSVTNFPAPDRNPFAPANAEEEAALSNESWIGVEGERAETLYLQYEVDIPDSQQYFFYSRKFWEHGAFRWRWDDQPWQNVGTDVYLMDERMVRPFLSVNWISLGQVELNAGTHQLRIELTENNGVAAFDCFVLTQEPFQPRSQLKPGEPYTVNEPGWFVFDPAADAFTASPIDLRWLNEAFAGENGLIQVKGESFIHEKTGKPVRFWAVNVGDALEMDQSLMAYTARFLAKKGVNLVRFHTRLWSNDLQIDPDKLDRLFAFVAALKQEGIYSCLSIYFPLWLQPNATQGFAGYNGQHPFSLLFFNAEFQNRYYDWWQTILTTPNPYTGKPLRDDAAVAIVELVNEDSYLFWTFDPYKSVPAPAMAELEQQFGNWLLQKYGSLDAALESWSTSMRTMNSVQGDRPETGQMGILPLQDILSQRDSRRAQDTATFLTQSQAQFFQNAIQFFREDLNYRGLIYASNWVTANAEIFGPLDKYSNTVADFMDRHAYFSGLHEGEQAGYAISEGDTYQDRSALRFSSVDPKQSHDFNLPIMDIRYNGLPSTVTEINWVMPNRFQADFPVLAASYGALQGSDGFFFFATSKHSWETTLGKFAIATPTIVGQFPATALMYRQGLLKEGQDVVNVTLKLEDLYALRGAPVVAPQNLDALRASDIPSDRQVQSDQLNRIDPLASLVGKVNLNFSQDKSSAQQIDLSQYIDRNAKTIRSSTNELFWNYDQGWVTINAPKAQGVTGFLDEAGKIELADVTIDSDLEYGAVLLVPLDNKPLAQSQEILLQVMSENRNAGWQTAENSPKAIENTGYPPILVRDLSGQITLKRPDASTLQVSILDANGYSQAIIGTAGKIQLQPNAFYYLIKKL